MIIFSKDCNYIVTLNLFDADYYFSYNPQCFVYNQVEL